MKILVSGVTGFVGKHLIKNLQKIGYEVIAIVRNETSAAKISDKNIICYIDNNDINSLIKFLKNNALILTQKSILRRASNKYLIF